MESLWKKIARVKARRRPGRSYKREVKSFRHSKNYTKYKRRSRKKE